MNEEVRNWKEKEIYMKAYAYQRWEVLKNKKKKFWISSHWVREFFISHDYIMKLDIYCK